MVILTHSITDEICRQRKHGKLEGYSRKRVHLNVQKRGNLKRKTKQKKVGKKKPQNLK